jgi:hypothetical protein
VDGAEAVRVVAAWWLLEDTAAAAAIPPTNKVATDAARRRLRSMVVCIGADRTNYIDRTNQSARPPGLARGPRW